MKTINTNSNEEMTWQQVILKYARPDLKKSIWQIINSVVPYLFMWYIMYRSLEYPYWVTLLLSLLAVGFLIRIFIIFHDCGHRSFFKSRHANNIVGMIAGIMVFTPYHKWHQQHKIHHDTSANLDKRGVGDVWTMTVEEYQEATPWRRLVYRTFRNPWIMFTIGSVFVVFLQNRLTRKKMARQEKLNVHFTNLMLLLMAVSISLVIGIKAFLLIQIPIVLIAHSIGIWLFYIQHQFDDVDWERQDKWDYKTSAVNGSSFLKLPAVFQWFTGNIGFHHVHHLSSKIPNYNLERCHNENAIFSDVKPLYFINTFKTLNLGLWDEANRQLISFSRLKVA
jgi:omega-6 fatty acid desaturase (delta-12 desaturase)